MTDEEMVQAWKDRIYSKSDEIDPESERYWFDLAYGFFLGLGADAAKAYGLAIEIESRKLL